MDAALVAATWALVVATIGLVIFAGDQAMAGWDARDEAKRQADLLAESLDVSRRLLDAAENERAAAAPLELRVDRVDSAPGSTTLDIRNDSNNAAMRLARVQINEMPSGDVVKDESLAEGTIGVNEGWRLALEWDSSRVGTTYVVRTTGRRLGGPEMTREFAFRVAADGTLEDLGKLVPQIFFPSGS